MSSECGEWNYGSNRLKPRIERSGCLWSKHSLGKPDTCITGVILISHQLWEAGCSHQWDKREAEGQGRRAGGEVGRLKEIHFSAQKLHHYIIKQETLHKKIQGPTPKEQCLVKSNNAEVHSHNSHPTPHPLAGSRVCCPLPCKPAQGLSGSLTVCLSGSALLSCGLRWAA